MATVLVIAAIAVGLVVASLLRRARSSECLVVTRHRRIVRIASDATTLAVPGFHEVLEWPTGQIEIAVVVRTRTGDGRDVRVLATFSVEVDPPRVGAAYIDPRAVLHTALERRVTDAVRARPAALLTDERDGVDLLLHPGRPDDDG